MENNMENSARGHPTPFHRHNLNEYRILVKTCTMIYVTTASKNEAPTEEIYTWRNIFSAA